MADITVNSIKKLNKNGSEKKHIKYSIFFITWNSNYVVKDNQNPAFIALESSAEKYFQQKFLQNIDQYIVVDDMEKVKSIDCGGAFEIGSIKQCYHCHLYVRVDHYTKVKIDLERLKKETRELINAPGSYINIQGTNDTKQSIKDYIDKYNIINKL